MPWTCRSTQAIRATARGPFASATISNVPRTPCGLWVLRQQMPASTSINTRPPPLRSPFSQLAALRGRRQGDKEGGPDFDAGNAAPTKASLSQAINAAASNEGGGGGTNRGSRGRRGDSFAQQKQEQLQQEKEEEEWLDPSLKESGGHGSIPQAIPDAVAEGHVLGRTGGGKRLESSSRNAPPQPKILNAGVPGGGIDMHLTEEQKREVARHNEEFAHKFDRGQRAADDKVDEKFWSGSGNNIDDSPEKDTNEEGQRPGGRDARGKDDRVDKTFLQEQRSR